MRNYLLSASRIMCQMTSMRREDGAACRCREPSILLSRESRPHWLFRWLRRISASWRLLRMRLITYWSKRRMWNGLCGFWNKPVIRLNARAARKSYTYMLHLRLFHLTSALVEVPRRKWILVLAHFPPRPAHRDG